MRSILLVALLAVLMGCTSGPAANITVVNDTTLNPPTISPTGYVRSAPQAITLSFDEPVILTSFRLNNETKGITRVDERTYRYNGTFPDGSYSVSGSAEDAAGNTVGYSASFTVDTAAPTVTINPEDNEQLASPNATITLTFSEPVTLSNTRLGSTAIAFSTTDNKTFTAAKVLADGSYILSFTATDRAGNTMSSNTTFTVNIATPDHTAPPQITGLNATNTGNGGEIKLSWDASTVNDFKEYRLYKSSSSITSVFGLVPFHSIPSRVTTQYPVSGLTDGKRYCFAVTAVDNSNNELGDVADACATPSKKDKTPPSITGNSPTGTVSSTNTPIISVTTDEAASCRYAVSNSSDKYYTYSNLTAMDRASNKTTHTKAVPALLNGTYTAYVICKDTAGNTMGSAYTWDFTVAYADTTPPTITITSPSSSETSSTVWFNATTDESASSCSYNVNGTNVSMDGSGTSWHKSTNISDGDYNVTFYCTDAAGNTDSATKSFNVNTTVADATPPTVSISSPIDSHLYNTTAIRLEFTATDDTDTSLDCTYSINSSAYSMAVNNTNISGNLSGDGAYTLLLNCTDDAGNTKTEGADFIVDTTAPQWNPTPTNRSIGSGAEFRYDANATDMTTIAYVVNGTIFSMNQTTGVLANSTFLSDGSYLLILTATDEASNTNSTQITITVG